jgi:hypothetical protein
MTGPNTSGFATITACFELKLRRTDGRGTLCRGPMRLVQERRDCLAICSTCDGYVGARGRE